MGIVWVYGFMGLCQYGISLWEERASLNPGLADEQQAQAVEADEHGAAFMPDDTQRQRQGKAERGDHQYDDHRAGKNQVLQQDAPCPAGMG